MKKLINILCIAFIAALFIWTYQRNEIDPEVDPILTTIVEDWKKDIDAVGLNGSYQIKRIDKIIIVDRIPYGLLNGRTTKGVMGRSDYSTRSIYILNRNYSRGQLKALVYHELGHYIFQLDHDPNESHIMHTYIEEEPGYYKKNWNTLLPIYLKKCKEKY
jgi:hypothetical protein